MSRKREKGRGLFGRGRPDEDDDCVEIDGEANRWWTERDHLDHRVNPPRQGREADIPRENEPSRGGFQTYFTTESLFESADRRPPGAEPAADPGEPIRSVPLPSYPGHGRDPFEVLGVRPGATLAEITVRHRQLAKQYHPDLHEVSSRFEAEQTMIEVNAAYSELRRVLRNVERMRVSAS